MSLGLSNKLRILQQSPHDFETAPPSSPDLPETSETNRWVASRYNVRASASDGRLILWNSIRGTMSVFSTAQREKVEGLLGRKGFEAPLRGAVKYLYERGFLVKEGTNEYRRIQLSFGQAHYRSDAFELILLASEDCNFRCTYCYEDFARGTMQPWVREGIKKLVEAKISHLRYLNIGWFGGEPLYGLTAIEELAPYLQDLARRHSVRYTSHMTTNGYLLTPEVAEKLLAWGCTTFQITIDGLPEDHNRNRPTRDGQGSFDTILANLKAMTQRPKEQDFSVNVRFNFDQHNSQGFSAFLDILERELGHDQRFKVRFHAVGKWGGANDDNLAICGVNDGWSMVREMKQEVRKRGLNLGEELTDLKMGSQVCYAARPYNFVIGASGKIMKCTVDLDRKDRNVIGHLTEDGRLETDLDKLALWTEPAFETDAKCHKCVILPVCQGLHCPQIRMDTGDSPCSSLRTQVKMDMLEMVDSPYSPGRRPVGAEEAAKLAAADH